MNGRYPRFSVWRGGREERGVSPLLNALDKYFVFLK
jgi:hypothetical protein